ncbi:MAG: ABC-ATPase UvrA [Candidatus Magasanikbacteria bacterium RIFCSPHIGHO2_02_FULL_50_9b]|uniref:UvrABC system protein A n=1 Tax=Candidatus Magasanikbacteria bacterium RIFCSPHIGHO2_02_FULL_50_9b TaxID=1798682 RepID=A0A1F6M911_9BACT|nr:MAG: ABC-ATPase UvrA [Candidatus Magasanikbacteria bacterium RIFCSPHIGHO2_02_FULL_50_9b]
MQDFIRIRGAREHNLKNISLDLPRNKLIVFAGLSGSGKSSLAFDTIFAEGQRRYIESLSAYARQFLGGMQKPDVDEIEGLSPAIAIDQKAHSANPRSTVATITEMYDYLRVLFARVGVPHCIQCGDPIQRLTAEQIVSLVIDALPKNGSGEIKLLAPVVRGRKGEYYQLLYDLYNAGFMEVRVDGALYSLKKQIKLGRYEQHMIEVVVDTIPVLGISQSKDVALQKSERQRLAEAVETALLKSSGLVTILFPDTTEKIFSTTFACPRDGFSFPEIEPRLFSFNSPYGNCQICTGLGTESLFSEKKCPACLGARLRPEALAVRIGGKNIVELTSLTIRDAQKFLERWFFDELDELRHEIAEPAMREILARLQFLLNVGLHYLTLARLAGSLSGGEAQRIRLASQIGSRLVGALYVLDEPTIGLHQADNEKLIKTLCELRDIGNTIIVVEHDEDTIRVSDHLVEIGPGAGVHGGEIVVEGATEKLLAQKKSKSLTVQYLNGEKKIALPLKRREKVHDTLRVIGATAHNLKNIAVEIPLRRFVCVTGVSGSGKSTLVHDIVYKSINKRLNHTNDTTGEHKQLRGVEYVERIILVDQSAIGRTSRSNPATYTGAWTPIRELFASTPEARARGYRLSRFSFNVPGGRCEHCEGHGELAIEMHFLPTVWVPCEVCTGARFDRETLEVTYKEKNISQILKMTIEEAEKFFEDIPAINDKLKMLNQVGLEYLELGQSAPTLSGGESQRVKLATELAKRTHGRALYIFDEPTTGLHFADIQKLLDILQKLVDRGNTVLVIEHNLDIIKSADWIIDLGPGGGDEGGTVVATGTPEAVSKNKNSLTGKYLKKVL